MAINVLPDDVLLEMFDLDQISEAYYHPWKWVRLTHVCRKWRRLVFASPLRLNLLIICEEGIPVRKNLCIWPTIPIIMHYGHYQCGIQSSDENNVFAALEHPDRLCRVRLTVKGSQLRKIAEILQKPCPMLTMLSITSVDRNASVLPDGFLGGSASHLQKFDLRGVPFPSLPTLLLSTTDLVGLELSDISPAGYIPPEVMVAHLAPLLRLKTFRIGFQIATSRSDHILPPSITRKVLPSLQELMFSGDFEYLEGFLARIDTPQLNSVTIDYCDQDIYIEVPQLSAFFDRSKGLKKTLSPQCQVMFHDGVLEFRIIGIDKEGHWDSDDGVSICVRCQRMYWQILQLSHVLSCISYSLLSDVVHFNLYPDAFMDEYEKSELEVLYDIDWLQLFRPLSSVRTLSVSGDLTRHVCDALENIAGAMVTEMLPALDLLYLDDQPISSIQNFITVRQASGHPVTFIDTSSDFHQRLESSYS
jgi:hypothetical protein